ncbi:MAG: hypothetical protein U0169_13155 [Polyangiaceae bacterium]
MGPARRPFRRWVAIVIAACGLAPVASGCAEDFDTKRTPPPRGTAGQEIYTVVCDRVGAQAVRDDVSGESFHAVCHANSEGVFATTLDRSLLPPLQDGAVDVDGNPVSMDQQTKNRDARIHRFETLAANRALLAGSLDRVLPDMTIPVLADGAKADATGTCARSGGESPFRTELAATLGRLGDLYNDGTVPETTRAVGRVLREVTSDPVVTASLAKMFARTGYRHPDHDPGLLDTVLDYPRLADLAGAVLPTFAVGGSAGESTALLFRAGAAELRTPATKAKAALVLKPDAILGSKVVASRPRTLMEIAEALLLAETADVRPNTTLPTVSRDSRGVAKVRGAAGALAKPFVDADKDGLADLDGLGRYVTSGAAAPVPYARAGAGADKRDAAGRAIDDTNAPVFEYLDVSKLAADAVLRRVSTLLDPDEGKDGLFELLGAFPALGGERDAEPTKSVTFGNAEVRYKSFHAAKSPLVDLMYALGVVASDPTLDDTLALLETYTKDHPDEMARVVAALTSVLTSFDAHPEATLKSGTTLADDLFDALALVVDDPTLLDPLIGAVADPRLLGARRVLNAFFSYKDEITYVRDANDKANEAKLNGPLWNESTQKVIDPMTPFSVGVDRTRPDTGANKSQFQKLIAVLHDTKGVAVCNKEGAVAKVKGTMNGLALDGDYPSNGLAQGLCSALGTPAPKTIAQCGLLRIPNLSALIVDVALGRASIEISDPCLKKMTTDPALSGNGGGDALLEQSSGIKGFGTKPTLSALARMASFDAPYSGLTPAYTPSDFYPKTRDFLGGVMEAVPTRLCPETPITDAATKTTTNVRTCTRYDQTVRGRHANALFVVDTMGFVDALRPVLEVFSDAKKPLVAVELLDTMAVHWGTDKQSKEECDPSLPRTDARWCSQAGLSRFEPLLAELMRSDLLPALQAALKSFSATTVQHCETFGADGVCTKATAKTGRQILGDLVRLLASKERWKNLTTRDGKKTLPKGDGTPGAAVTPLALVVDAIRHASATDTAGSPSLSKTLRDVLDAFFATTGTAETTTFASKLPPELVGRLLGIVRTELAARCPASASSSRCPWVDQTLVPDTAKFVEGPLFASIADIGGALYADKAAKDEMGRFVHHVFAANDGKGSAAVSLALVDAMELLADDAGYDALVRVAATALDDEAKSKPGALGSRGMASAVITTLSRFFAVSRDSAGAPVCSASLDPNRTMITLAKNLLRVGPDGTSAADGIVDVAKAVNRKTPGAEGALAPEDVSAIASEFSEFMLDSTRGIEQVYKIVARATAKSSP